MKSQFFKNKIENLSDENLLDLIIKASKDPSNTNIFDIAKKEAEKRNLQFDLKEDEMSNEIEDTELNNETEELKRWNWGAFFLAPFWALSNKLDKWAILSLLPPVNLIAIFYLGFNGNKLAFEKSEIKSVNDFMQIQRTWSKWGIRIFWILLVFGFLEILLNY